MQKIWRRKIITLLMAISKRKALFDERGISVRLVRVCSSLPVNRTRTQLSGGSGPIAGVSSANRK
jgi:hypothetical protein